MDILDNLMYAKDASSLQPTGARNRRVTPRIRSEFINEPPLIPGPVNVGTTLAPVFAFNLGAKLDYCSYEDPVDIEQSAIRHWYDVNAQVNYDSGGVQPAGTAIAAGESRFSSFERTGTYHLIYAYLLENTRILQIFERLIEKYLNDEELGIAENSLVFNWIQNSEFLFFRGELPRYTSLRTVIRPISDSSRRNAYWRMFGMDLAFGDINSQGSATIPYVKALRSNQQFVALFERYLSEVWQSFTNANNSAGVNPTDITNVVDLSIQLRELLVARRGNTSALYGNQNLSREEFASVLMTSWFTFVISDDTPIVEYLNCQSSTIGERLLKIGNKVGVPAHSKCQSLFEMAGAAAHVLSTIEQGLLLNDAPTMRLIISSLLPTTVNPDPNHVNLMTDLLTIINNWEKATGHRIKNPEANIIGTVKIQQVGQKPQPVMN